MIKVETKAEKQKAVTSDRNTNRKIDTASWRNSACFSTLGVKRFAWPSARNVNEPKVGGGAFLKMRAHQS